MVAAHQVNFDMMWYYLRADSCISSAISALATWIMNLFNNHMTYHIVQDIRSQAIRHIQYSAILSGPAQYRRYRKPYHCRYNLIRWDATWIYPVVFRNCNDCCNVDLHVFQEFLDHTSGHCSDTIEFLSCQIYFFQIFKMFRKQSETRGRQTALIEEMIGNQKVVKAFGYEKESSREI